MITHVLDRRAIARALKGSWAVRANFQTLARCQVGAPERLMAEVAVAVARARNATLALRFERLAEQVARLPWSEAVEKRYIQLRLRRTPLDELDAVVAAHVLVVGGTLVTSGPSALRKLRGIAVEDWK
jgi:predicted nucleic acid-binding protein